MPLDQLLKGQGRCDHKVDGESSVSLDFRVESAGEVSGTKVPPQRRPGVEHNKDAAVQRHHNDMRMTMRTNRLEDQRTAHSRPAQTQSQCEQELEKVLDEISKMTFLNNKGSLENLYELKFPNCDKEGQYNLKQCHMSTHGQRGHCWCVDPLTGIQLPSSPKMRGDPNCGQYLSAPTTKPPAHTWK